MAIIWFNEYTRQTVKYSIFNVEYKIEKVTANNRLTSQSE